MTTEEDLLTNFLIDRCDLPTIIDEKKFSKMFSVGTSANATKALYKHINRVHKDRLNAVRNSITERKESSERKKSIKLSHLKRKYDESSMKEINEKLNTILHILEGEESNIEKEYEEQLQYLKDLNDDFNRIVYTKPTEEKSEEHSVEELLENLQEFEKNINIT